MPLLGLIDPVTSGKCKTMSNQLRFGSQAGRGSGDLHRVEGMSRWGRPHKDMDKAVVKKDSSGIPAGPRVLSGGSV